MLVEVYEFMNICEVLINQIEYFFEIINQIKIEIDQK